jgi:hypothetical protein
MLKSLKGVILTMEKVPDLTIENILKIHKVYSVNLELDLLRYFEKLRNSILKRSTSNES